MSELELRLTHITATAAAQQEEQHLRQLLVLMLSVSASFETQPDYSLTHSSCC